jgi:uncharacterized protein (TIGR02391 family)
MADQKLKDIIPDPENALALQPEELAGAVIQCFNSAGLQMFSIAAVLRTLAGEYEQRWRERVVLASMEACNWLEREGLIIPYPGHQGCYFISRRGTALTDATKLAAFRHADMLPRNVVHPLIVQKVYGAFLRGEYDTAVFQAFREVEIKVRSSGAFAATDLGVALMRKAFEVTSGPLSDTSSIAAERQAESDLFAGAIGLFKNPTSHRSVTISAPEAAERIMLASHLLRTVDSRAAKATPQGH